MEDRLRRYLPSLQTQSPTVMLKFMHLMVPATILCKLGILSTSTLLLPSEILPPPRVPRNQLQQPEQEFQQQQLQPPPPPQQQQQTLQLQQEQKLDPQQ